MPTYIKQFYFVGMQFSSNEKFCRRLQLGSNGEFPMVRINSVLSGVKISINAFEDQIVYSDVLLALEEFGLEVVNAASSSITNMVFHTIHNKVFYYAHSKIIILYPFYRIQAYIFLWCCRCQVFCTEENAGYATSIQLMVCVHKSYFIAFKILCTKSLSSTISSIIS